MNENTPNNEDLINLKAHVDQTLQNSQYCSPVLIDFGGLSYYQCGSLPKSCESLLEKYFHAWINIPIENSARKALDLKECLSIANNQCQKIVKLWKNQTTSIFQNRLASSFCKWKKYAIYQVHKREMEKKKNLQIINFWRVLSLKSRLEKKATKLYAKKLFRIWKQKHDVIKLLPKVEKNIDRKKKRRTFQIWRTRFLLHNRKTKVQLFKSKKNALIINKLFDKWYCLFLSHTRIFPHDQYTKNSFFSKWKTLFIQERIIISKKNDLEKVHSQHVYRKVLVKWERKVGLSKKKRSRNAVNKWKRIISNGIKYSQLQKCSELHLMKNVIDRMNKKIQEKNKIIEQSIFLEWRKIVIVQRKKEDVNDLCGLYKLSRCFGHWHRIFCQREEAHEITFVMTRVVEPICKRHYFMLWLERAIKSYKTNQRKSRRFRQEKLMKHIFEAWHGYVKMNNIRAINYFNSNRLRETFYNFKAMTLDSKQEKEAKALEFRRRNLLAKYFNKFEHATRKYTLDPNMEALILMLNSGPSSFLFQ